MVTFEDITLNRQDEYLDLLGHTGMTASDYSFINLWGWAQEYGLSWAWDNGLVWIRQAAPSPCLWAPVGQGKAEEWPAVLEEPAIRDLPFTRVPEDLLRQWEAALPGKVHAEEARGHWDYLYSVPELVELAGNRFHKKKNLLNQFRKRYPYRYQAIEQVLIEKVLAMQEDWCTWRDCESLEMLASENRVITRVLNAWERLSGIRGAAIFSGDDMVAFTVAEALTEDMLIIHFEKGLHDYTGVYQAINQMFLENTPGFSLVNREQDLNDEGLRTAKLSYNPAGFVRKYHVRFI